MSHPQAPERQNTSNRIHTGKSTLANRRQRRSAGVYCQLLIKVLKKKTTGFVRKTCAGFTPPPRYFKGFKRVVVV